MTRKWRGLKSESELHHNHCPEIFPFAALTTQLLPTMPKPHLEDEEHNDGRDQAEDDYGDEEGHHDRKKKKKKVKIMTNSGQTEADRRLLRRKQRELHQEIAVGSAETSGGMEDPNSGEFERMRGKNNELFEEVRYTREAVLDSENMDLITAKAARQVERIVQVSSSDCDAMFYVVSFVFSSRRAK